MRLIVKVAVAAAVGYAAYRAMRYLAPNGIDSFAKDVKAGMDEREAQLREAIGLDVGADGTDASPPGRHAMTPAQKAAVLDDPTH